MSRAAAVFGDRLDRATAELMGLEVPPQTPDVPTLSAAGETLPINAGNVQVLVNLLWPGNRFVVQQVDHDGEVAITFRNGRAPSVVHGRLGEPVLPLLLAVQKALRRHGSDLL